MDQLTEATTEAFQQYPDYAVITSFPGLADLSGARVLGEIGEQIVAVHGQSDQWRLQRPDQHREVLDDFGDTTEQFLILGTIVNFAFSSADLVTVFAVR